MSEQKIEFYKGPAGGWGALNSVKNALLRQDIPIKGASTRAAGFVSLWPRRASRKA